MVCTEKRGINRNIIENSLTRAKGEGGVSAASLVHLDVAAERLTQTIKEDRSTPTQAELVIIEACRSFASVSAVPARPAEPAAPSGAVELSGSFPGEFWTPATEEQSSWLKDSWCYPSLPSFKSVFRGKPGGGLQRQNSSGAPRAFVSDWVDVDVFVSNRGMFRLRHANEWAGNYLRVASDKNADFYENERYSEDDGTVKAGNKRLVLSCTRCTVSNDGVYSCR